MSGLRFVLAFHDWCVSCRRYTPHGGWARSESLQPTLGVCGACGSQHAC